MIQLVHGGMDLVVFLSISITSSHSIRPQPAAPPPARLPAHQGIFPRDGTFRAAKPEKQKHAGVRLLRTTRACFFSWDRFPKPAKMYLQHIVQVRLLFCLRTQSFVFMRAFTLHVLHAVNVEGKGLRSERQQKLCCVFHQRRSVTGRANEPSVGMAWSTSILV